VVVTFFLIKEEQSETPRTRTPVNVSGLLRLVFDRRLAAIEVTQMVSFITMSSIRTTMLPLYGVEYLGLPVSAIGTILSAGALVSFPVLMAISSVVDRIQRNVLIGGGFLGLAAAVYLYTLAQLAS
jgi:Na+/melibiose symporter-like transporter